jgi:hypothetical protein
VDIGRVKMTREEKINYIMDQCTFTDDTYWLDAMRRGLEIGYDARTEDFKPLEKMYNILKQQKEDLIEAQEILIKAHDKTIEDYMSRTCESCKLFKNKKGNMDCILAIQTTHLENFGCSLWESKE